MVGANATGFDAATAVLESVRTTTPIDLDPSLPSVLSFKHQVDLLDDTTVNTSAPSRSATR